MADAPWFKFFPSDWLTGVRRLSGLERGVYISLIAMMYDHGKPLADDLKELAEDCGVTRRQFDAALAELVRRGKIIQTENGLWNERVSCEILARFERISNSKAAVAERERRKTEEKQRSETSVDDQSMIGRSSIQNQNQKLEVEVEEEKKESCPKPASPPSGVFGSGDAESKSEPKPKKRVQYPEDFEQFWSLYPADRRIEKKPAAEFWIKKMDRADRERAIASMPGFKKWLATQRPDYKAPWPVNFLKTERYNDEALGGESRIAQVKVDWNARLTYGRSTGQWDTYNWGPMPGHPDCRAPVELLKPDDGKGWGERKKAS